MHHSVRHIIACLLLLAAAPLLRAQQQTDNPAGTHTVKTKNIRHEIHAWTLQGLTARADTTAPDTAYLNYMQRDAIHRHSIDYAYNGNLLSPLQSKIYFDRQSKTGLIFSDAFTPYLLTPQDIVYYNTRTPYSNITWRTGGKTYRKEDQVSFMFAGNANKRIGYGITLNYMAPIGSYAHQSGRNFNGSLNASYNGTHYYVSAAAMLNNLSVHENGGLTDTDQLSDQVQPQDASTRLQNALTAHKYWAVYVNHGYRIGYTREQRIGQSDTLQTLFVPVLTFAHTLQIDRAAHRFYETRVDTAFFPNTYLNQNVTNDTAALRTIQNTLSVTLEEAASPLGFGLTAYLHNNTRQYLYLQGDSLIRHRWQSDLMLGAEATRQAGRYFHFLIDGQICLAGYRLGQYKLGAQLQGHIPLGRHTLDLTAYARSESRKPDLLEHTYLSNHFRRSDLDLRSTLTNHIGAQAAFAHPNISASLRVDMQNLTHAIYYTNGGLKQYDGNIQIVAADLNLRLNSRHFALDNHAVWQQTSSYVIALPQITLYENIYYYARWFNQLDVQFGVDMRYHTAYYAPLYMPGLGQFTVQQHTRVAPPPILSVYANLRIKTVRFYVAYTHFNQLLSDHYDYYSMPLYPLNPASLRLGISWNFFN